MSRALRQPGGPRRGGFLLEVILSLSIFVMVGLAAVSLTSNALNAARRSAHLRQAVDIARTTVSRIEIGDISPETAQGPVGAWTGAASSADGDAPQTLPGWWIDVESGPGPLSELTALTLRIRHDQTPGADGSRGEVIYTFQQLVRLGTSAAAAGGAE